MVVLNTMLTLIESQFIPFAKIKIQTCYYLVLNIQENES